MLTLDHLVISATSLAEGVAHIERVTGTRMAPGGRHPLMGTHNRLLGLGDIYLEVIAIDPEARPPGRPRWFDLDRFGGAPRLTNWVARCPDIARALAVSPPGAGVITPLSRGDLSWEMAVPDDGNLPFGGAFPGLIRWHGARHPVQGLPETGLRLERLEIACPDSAALRASLAGRLTDERIVITEGPATTLQARLSTPRGTISLAPPDNRP